MHIVFVSPEAAPYTSTTALGVQVSELAAALADRGQRVTVIAPYYQGTTPERYALARRIRKIQVGVGGAQEQVGLLEGKFTASNVSLLLVDHPASFPGPGALGGPGADAHVTLRRSHVLCAAALQLIQELTLEPDLIHAHHWATALLPLLASRAAGAAPAPRVHMTLYDPQDDLCCAPADLQALGLGPDLPDLAPLQRGGGVSLTRLGLATAAQANTTSPTLGRQLSAAPGALWDVPLPGGTAAQLPGVLPGLDTITYNPATDYRLPAQYGPQDLQGKAACKRAAQEELGLPVNPEVPLLVCFPPHHGAAALDLLLRTIPQLPLELLQIGLLGPLPEALGSAAAQLAQANPGSLAQLTELPRDGLRRALAGADALLSPEPCDLTATQLLLAQRYGAAPVAHAAGATLDAVMDFDPPTATGTGILYGQQTPESLAEAVQRLRRVHAQPQQREALCRNALRVDASWARATRQYLELYARLGA